MTSILQRVALIAFALIALSPHANAQTPSGDPGYKMAPALTGDRGRVFVGTQTGTIFIATSTTSGISITDSLVRSGSPGANNILPQELRGVWNLSMPNRVTQPDLIVALVSYADGAATRYGILRSTDFGVSWTLIKDPVLANPMFVPSNDYWTWTTLRELTWLPDAQNGWAYGPKGIVATSDGGLTWTARYSKGASGADQVNALAFRDATNGVASIGWNPVQRFAKTNDGGMTFTLTTPPIGGFRIAQMDWIGNEYRALVFDRFKKSGQGLQTWIYRSSDEGTSWDAKVKGNMDVEQTPHTEILWTNDRTGVMVIRSGELWATTNGGTNWALVQNADSVNYRMPLGIGVGFGYASITLDNKYIVHAGTLATNGRLDTIVQWGLVTSGVDDESKSIFTATNLIPTPSQDRVRVTLDRATSVAARIVVVDATGSVMLVEQPGSGHMTLSLDISALSIGHYRLMIDDGDRRIVAPLLITR